MANQKVTPYKNLDVQPTASNVVSAPCKACYIYAHNKHATNFRYLKFYDKVDATQADTPIATIALAPLGVPFVADRGTKDGIPFDVALSIRATTGIADNDTGAPSANDVSVNIGTVENLEYTL